MGAAGLAALNQALEQMYTELERVEERVERAKRLIDPTDKISPYDLQSFIAAITSRLSYLTQTSRELRIQHRQHRQLGRCEPLLVEERDVATAEKWKRAILKQIDRLRESSPFKVSTQLNFEKFARGKEENLISLFTQLLNDVESQIDQEPYKLRVEKTETDKRA